MDTFVNDDRAVIDENSYCWTDVELKQGQIMAYYSFSWSSYYGCDDFNNEDEVYGHIEIEYSEVDGTVSLPVFQGWDKPNTFEEF